MLLITHPDIAPFEWGNQGTEKGSGLEGHKSPTGFLALPASLRGQETTRNCLDNEVMVTSFLAFLPVPQQPGGD